ncbi:hypothetical protein ACFO3O_06800 [Dokdonia ponticola]|uniref:Uncharacterized protein n=1 Tax=Dokdonia ponticola TaxID=2041041 RepID=A0ABV9HUE5_9FLAO
MKTYITTGIVSSILFIVFFAATSSHTIPTTSILNMEVAPQVEGKITIDGKSTLTTELEEGNVVEFFKKCKTGNFPIIFSFDGSDLPKDDQGRGIVLFEFETEIYKDGKLLGAVKRKPMPFFPGEMLEPVETFDIIHLLTYAQGNPLKNEYPGKLEKGKYTIVLSANPVGATGTIEKAQVVVWI